MFIYTYRYMWKTVEKPDNICFKIVSDVEDGHKKVCDMLVNDDKILSSCREYLSQIDVEKLCKVETVKEEKIKEDDKNEKI